MRLGRAEGVAERIRNQEPSASEPWVLRNLMWPPTPLTLFPWEMAFLVKQAGLGVKSSKAAA